VSATAATPEIVSGSAGRLVPRLLILAVLILTTLALALVLSVALVLACP
jgi:hypothetical protein